MAWNPPVFWDLPASFWEYARREPLPIRTIQVAVLEFLRGRDDAALFGALAVNAYVSQTRATKDVDILAVRPAELAEDVRAFLTDRFSLAVRVSAAPDGVGRRVGQIGEPKDRRLVDVHSIAVLPPTQRIEELLVVSPHELIAQKARACHGCRGQAQEGLHRRDLIALFHTFPELKADPGPVRARLEAVGADQAVLAAWEELAAQELVPEDEDGEFD
jgi:hypothetical protein